MTFLIGLLIISVGGYFLAINLGMETTATEFMATFWPALFILIGLRFTFRGGIRFLRGILRLVWMEIANPHLFWGLAIVIASSAVLAGNLGYIDPISLGDIWGWTWPLLIIYFGIRIVVKRSKSWLPGPTTYGNNSWLNNYSWLKNWSWDIDDVKGTHAWVGETHLGNEPWKLEKHMYVRSWVGDIHIDLTQAIIENGESILDIRQRIGDVSIVVPEDLAVRIQARTKVGETHMFNNVSNYSTYESEHYEQAERRVYIRASQLVGEINIRRAD